MLLRGFIFTLEERQRSSGFHFVRSIVWSLQNQHEDGISCHRDTVLFVGIQIQNSLFTSDRSSRDSERSVRGVRDGTIRSSCPFERFEFIPSLMSYSFYTRDPSMPNGYFDNSIEAIRHSIVELPYN